MKLQLWFGILFSPPEKATMGRPRLPDWADVMFLTGATDDDMERALKDRGYTGEPLTWIEYSSGVGTTYRGVAIAESVQDSDELIGVVNTTYPEDVAERWITSISRAGWFLDDNCVSGAHIRWYNTLSPS